MTDQKPSCAHPAIVSASRVTDLPALFPNFLLKRLEEGFVLRQNPFSRKFSKIAFDKAQVLVLWSKNPAPLLPHLEKIKEHIPNLLVHFTLNEYESEGYEPGLPSLTERINTFKEISRALPKCAVIWRFDPLLNTPKTPPLVLLLRIRALAEKLQSLTPRLIISLADGIAKLKRQGLEVREFNTDELKELGAGLKRLAYDFKLEIQTCAEEPIFEDFGITGGACIDADLLNRLYGLKLAARKDPSQRKLCLCAQSRDIGMGNTCPHGCLYCYALKDPHHLPKGHADLSLPFLKLS